MILNKIKSFILVAGVLFSLAIVNPSSEKLPRYGELTSVPNPIAVAFRQNNSIFFFSVDGDDVDSKLFGTDWEVTSNPSQMNVSWVFQMFSQNLSIFPSTSYGPNSSVIFSFVGHNRITGENRTLVWAIRDTEESVDRLNNLYGGGNYLGEISIEYEDENETLKFQGNVKTSYGLNLDAKARLPKGYEYLPVKRDPASKFSFIDWSTDPPTIFDPFTLADEFYEVRYNNLPVQLKLKSLALRISSDEELHGFLVSPRLFQRINQFVSIQR